jgi:hypothetical protein
MRKHCTGIMLLFAVPAVLPAQPAQTPQEPRFIRLKEEGGKPAALEIAITRYTNKSKTVTVDLVGVVHVGDRAYYQQLNKRFPTYDVVLYELVAPPGTKVPAGGKKDGSSAFVTSLMTTLLDLESQLSCVDYRQKNFVHADLSFETMMAAARKRGESGLTLGLSVLADMLRQQNLSAEKKHKSPADDVDVFDALTNPNLLKRQMARQMVGSVDLGPTLQALLVADRNKKACEVLTEQIEEGREQIAIFYGAAHMPDFDKRLREEFGLRRQSQEWLTAWNLRDGQGDPGQRLKSLLEKALQGP